MRVRGSVRRRKKKSRGAHEEGGIIEEEGRRHRREVCRERSVEEGKVRVSRSREVVCRDRSRESGHRLTQARSEGVQAASAAAAAEQVGGL